jgi:hypothetical protein
MSQMYMYITHTCVMYVLLVLLQTYQVSGDVREKERLLLFGQMRRLQRGGGLAGNEGKSIKHHAGKLCLEA